MSDTDVDLRENGIRASEDGVLPSTKEQLNRPISQKEDIGAQSCQTRILGDQSVHSTSTSLNGQLGVHGAEAGVPISEESRASMKPSHSKKDSLPPPPYHFGNDTGELGLPPPPPSKSGGTGTRVQDSKRQNPSQVQNRLRIVITDSAQPRRDPNSESYGRSPSSIAGQGPNPVPFDATLGKRVDKSRYYSLSGSSRGISSPLQSAVSPESLNTELWEASISGQQDARHAQLYHSPTSTKSTRNPMQSPSSFHRPESPVWASPYQPDKPSTSRATSVIRRSSAKVVPSTSQLDPRHTFTSGIFQLYLNKGTLDSPPAYGRGELVEGYVQLKDTDHISGIKVTLEGELQVVFSAMGRSAETSKVCLFSECKKLYTSVYNELPGDVYTFSFEFPQRCDASDTPLPPSWRLEKTGVSALVSYRIRADVKRNGMLRRDEKLIAHVEYYPRTGPSPKWESRQPPLRVLSIENNMPFTVHISLKAPVVYPSGTPIDYTITFSSREHADVPPNLDVQVQLIKVMEMCVKNTREENRKVLADGQNEEPNKMPGVYEPSSKGHRRRVTENGNEPLHGVTCIIKGTCQAGEQGHEMSWKVKNFISIKYYLRFVVMLQKHTETPLDFEHLEEIILTTDPASTLRLENEASLPAIGLRQE